MTNLEIQSTDRDAQDKLDMLLRQVGGKARSHQGWFATYEKTPDGHAVLSLSFPAPPPAATPPATTDQP